MTKKYLENGRSNSKLRWGSLETLHSWNYNKGEQS